MNLFGEKLKMLRKQKGITLKDLAVQLGFNSHSYFSELESGKKKPTVDAVLSVARFFQVSTDYLLKDEITINDSNTEN